MNTYTVEKGKITNKNGLPCLPRWFCDDRLSVKYDRYGIGEIDYFSPKVSGSVHLFVTDMFGGLKFYIDDSGRKKYIKLGHTEVMPYGFVSEIIYGDSKFRFEQRVVNNSIYMSVSPKDVCHKNLKFVVEFYDSFGYRPTKEASVRYRSSVSREWEKWQFENNVLYTSFTSEGKSGYVAIGSNAAAEYIYRPVHFTKNILLFGGICEGEVKTVISVGDELDDTLAHMNEMLGENTLIREQNKRYQAVMNRIPVLLSAHEDLNNFFTLAPLYHESVKLRSHIGAMRARTNIYWAWGWDSMTAGNTYGYWGDVEFVGNMLRFFMETADPVGGLAHAYNRDMSHGETSMVSAQGFYICLLYVYYKNGGDISPFFEFAKKILGMIFDKEVGTLGLCSGKSLVPDYRELILENGNDISTFNNISAYCAVRSMEEMALGIGDTETYKRAGAFAAKTRENFDKILFDGDAGYYVSSADSITLEQRKTYMGMELKYENSFAQELVCNTQAECLRFFEEKLVNAAGINVFPLDNIAYDADSNQAHCWWPAHSEYYTRTINRLNRPDRMAQFMGWIENYTRHLMCPEGVNCYADTDEPYFDEWNAEPGTWQAFSMRGWYEAIVNNVVGVTFEEKELVLHPYSGEEMSILGINYYGKKFDIHMKGSGAKITSVELNGKNIGAVYSIGVSSLTDRNIITVNRTEE